MKKIVIAFALVAVLAGCDYTTDNTGNNTGSLIGPAAQLPAPASYDPTAPLFGDGAGSYVPGTDPLEVMTGG